LAELRLGAEKLLEVIQSDAYMVVLVRSRLVLHHLRVARPARRFILHSTCFSDRVNLRRNLLLNLALLS